jgi:cell division protein FtsN
MIGLLRFLPMVKTYAFAIIAAAILATVTLYVFTAERAKGTVKLLEAENAFLTENLRTRSAQITALNARLERHNAETLQKLATERARLIEARVAAKKMRQQRDQVTAALGESRREWQEALDHDENLAEFVAHDVPGAVWRRLCRATGDSGC